MDTSSSYLFILPLGFIDPNKTKLEQFLFVWYNIDPFGKVKVESYLIEE